MDDLASGGLSAPHAGIESKDARERFTLELFDTLWRRYIRRVSHARAYERVVREAGGTFVNDHIAFRAFARQEPFAGLSQVSRVFEALGYEAAACYRFPDKHLGSVHYQHPNPLFPKLFISELKTWELSEASRAAVARVVKSRRPPLQDETLAALSGVQALALPARRRLLAELARFFEELPWDPPARKDVLALDRESQFAAWVAVHGCEVNHFTASVNSHGCAALDDIEKTVEALRGAGVPMKAEIEGARGSKLRQSATEAVVIPVRVKDGGRTLRMDWTYAYFEIAERGEVADPATGTRARFEGFLGGQAAQLFEMTKLRH